MRKIFALLFLTLFSMNAHAEGLTDKFLNKKEDVFLKTANTWCVSAGALETKRRMLSIVYGEHLEGRGEGVFARKKSYVERYESNAKLRNWQKRLARKAKNNRHLLDAAQNCYDLVQFHNKIFPKKSSLKESFKSATLAPEDTPTYYIGLGRTYCLEGHVNDAKARVASLVYEGRGKYFTKGDVPKKHWIRWLKKEAKNNPNATKMIEFLEENKDELFAQDSCKALQQFINKKIAPFAGSLNFRVWS